MTRYIKLHLTLAEAKALAQAADCALIGDEHDDAGVFCDKHEAALARKASAKLDRAMYEAENAEGRKDGKT